MEVYATTLVRRNAIRLRRRPSRTQQSCYCNTHHRTNPGNRLLTLHTCSPQPRIVNDSLQTGCHPLITRRFEQWPPYRYFEIDEKEMFGIGAFGSVTESEGPEKVGIKEQRRRTGFDHGERSRSRSELHAKLVTTMRNVDDGSEHPIEECFDNNEIKGKSERRAGTRRGLKGWMKMIKSRTLRKRA